MKRKPFLFITALLIAALLPALADVSMDDAGLRYEAQEGESCLTLSGEQLGDRLPGSLGMSLEEATKAMENAGALLLMEQADGRQARVLALALPDDLQADSVWAMSEEQKAEALTYMRSLFSDDSGEWAQDGSGYAAFSNSLSTVSAADAPELRFTELRLATPYLGKLLVLETDVIGREADQSDQALLAGVAGRLLRLGEKEQAQTESKALGVPSLLTGAAAEITVAEDGIPIELDPVSADFPATTLILTGKTGRAISMRYYVNDKASSRFYSEDDGTFRVTVPSLENGKDNLIRVLVSDENKKGEISFTLHVSKQPVPVNLSLQMGCVTGEEVEVYGQTLAGAKVALGKRAAKATLQTQKDGSFILNAKLPQAGENKLTLTLSYKGYADNKVELNYVRLPQTQDELKQLTDSLKQIAYQELLAAPESYQSDMVYLEGTALQLRYEQGATYCLLADGDGNEYVVKTNGLYSWSAGQATRLLALCAGENAALFGQTRPLIQELTILPS